MKIKHLFLSLLLVSSVVVCSADVVYSVSEIMQVYESLNLSHRELSAEQYTVRGYVTKWNSGYPNYQNADFYIDDTADGSESLFECYRLRGVEESDCRTLQVGERVEATAYLQNYNGKAELCNGTFTIIPDNDEPVVEECRFKQLEGQTSTQLLASLNLLISDHTILSYIDTRADHSLIDIKSDGTVWDMYSLCTFYPSDYCNNSNYSTTTECECYNREHALPKSWWGSSEDEPMYTDLHHILPTDNAANQQRGADAFGVVVGTPDWSNSLGSKQGNTSTYSGGSYRKVFEPADQYKGDIARIYFYMLTCYRDKNFTQGGQGYRMFTYNNAVADFTVSARQLLLQWHRDDPVSQKELDRNDKIEELQGNRNPFVDDPNLVEFIWGMYSGRGYSCDIESLSDGVENISGSSQTAATKKIENGQIIIIIPDGRRYNAFGVEVK